METTSVTRICQSHTYISNHILVVIERYHKSLSEIRPLVWQGIVNNVLSISRTQIGQSTISAHQYADCIAAVSAYFLVDAICKLFLDEF